MIKQLMICFLLIGSPQIVAAQSVQDQIIAQLQQQGFTQIEVSRTWLGRVRIVSLRDDLQRELVFNPQTGEILRDFWQTINGDGLASPRIVDPFRDSGSGGGQSSGGGSSEGGGSSGGDSGSGGDDDDDDDGDDDDGDDDGDDDDGDDDDGDESDDDD